MSVVGIIFLILGVIVITYLDILRISRYEKRDIQRTNSQMEIVAILEEIRDGISYKE